MPSRVIPKEALTAYQRWELAAFEEAIPPGSPESEEAPPSQPEEGPEDVVVSLPTAEELQRIQQDAWNEGYQLGIAEGRQAGFEEGKKSGEHYARRLADLAEAMDTQRLRQDEQVAEEILQLALTVARQLVHTQIAVKPGVVIAAIQDALSVFAEIPANLRLALNPADVQEVRAWLAGEQGQIPCRILEDMEIERGGFRLESDFSEMHAELSRRWREIVGALGSRMEWLE